MKLRALAGLFLSTLALADTPPQVINKICPTSQWIYKIVPGQQPSCLQPSYSDISGTAPASAWGTITGTLANQADLQSALNAKQNTLTIGNLTAGTGVSVSGGTGAIIGSGASVGLANTAVSAGSYTNANITVDAQGRLTSAANGSASGVTAVTASSPLASSGGATPNLTIQTASGSQAGALSATDWTTFNSKQAALSFSSPLVNTTGTVSIPASTNSVNGYLTAADHTTFAGKQNAITPGSISSSTTGVTVGSGANSTIGPNVTVNVQTASGSQPGLLSSTDWTTFNGKETTLSFTSPLIRTVNTIACQTATGSVPGCISAADWTTFNAKQSALTFTTPIVNTAGTVAMAAATGSVNGYLTSTDWTTFNGKQSALTFGNLTDAGTDGITVTGGTGAVIGLGAALSQHVADSTHNGYLSSTDWSTFNGKGAGTVTSVGLSLPSFITVSGSPVTGSGTLTGTLATQSANTIFGGPSTGAAAAPTFRLLAAADIPSLSYVSSIGVTAPIASTGGLTPTISCVVATGSVAGCLSAVDWTTFNAKQAAGNYITALTGDATAAGPGSSALTLATVNSNVGSFTNSSVTVNAKGLVTAASNGPTPEVPLTFSTGLTRSTNTVTVNTSQNINTLSNLTGNGFVKTSGGTGALSIDTSTYLTGNQTVTLSGDVSGAGATAITTTIGANKVTNAQRAQMATLTIKGNNTGGTANEADLTVSQVNTMLGTFSNPMTTAGDMITGGVSGAPTRLAVGSAGQVVNSSGSAQQYSSLPGNTTILKAPTIQKFTTGGGTYTTPTSPAPLYISVEMVGGGGSGTGSGTGGATNGAAGTASLFGTTLLSAGGGGVGNYQGAGGAGGTSSLGTGPIGIALPGSRGDGYFASSATSSITGGAGGVSALGGGSGSAAAGGGGSAGGANTGSGGGGGATNNTTSDYRGSGGGSGGYVKAIITSPSSTYSYTVGAGGGGGSAGTNGFAGGNGGDGVVIVTEYYQ